jgi:hypothetical protein
MNKVIFKLGLLSLIISAPAFAEEDDEIEFEPEVYVGAAIGYGQMDDTSETFGDSAAGRLTIGLDVLEMDWLMLGIEVGGQSGNDVRFGEDVIGYPIDATLKPFIDALVTAKTLTDPEDPWGVFLKAGIAYQQLQFDNRGSDERDHVQKILPEVQAGIAYQVSKHGKITAFYQGIYGEDDPVEVVSKYDVSLEHIPTQQAGFLGFEYTL